MTAKNEVAELREQVAELAQQVTEVIHRDGHLEVAPGVLVHQQVVRDLSHAEQQAELLTPLIDNLARIAHDALGDLARETTAFTDALETAAVDATGAGKLEEQLRYLGTLLVTVADQTFSDWPSVEEAARKA